MPFLRQGSILCVTPGGAEKACRRAEPPLNRLRGSCIDVWESKLRAAARCRLVMGFFPGLVVCGESRPSFSNKAYTAHEVLVCGCRG